MTFDWTITLGQLVNAVTIVIGFGLLAQRIYYTLDKRITHIESKATDFVVDLGVTATHAEKQIDMHVSAIRTQMASHAAAVERQISTHAKTLEDHAIRMERWESTLFKVVADLQRVIGQMDIHRREWDGHNRRDGA